MRYVVAIILLICGLGWYFSSDPGEPQCCVLARDAAEHREFDRAISFYEEAITRRPGNLELRVEVARCYVMVGDKSAAAAHYRAAQPLMERRKESMNMRRHIERFTVLQAEGY